MKTNEIITQKIIEKLESGVIPWQKPWAVEVGEPVNFLTKKPYRGINTMLTGMQSYVCPYWVTFKQALELGGCVKKGEKGTPIIFWQFLEKENDEGETESIPMVKYYTVFNLSQCEGINYDMPEIKENNLDPVDSAEKVIKGYVGPTIEFKDAVRACYSSFYDRVTMPAKKYFNGIGEYYSTFFHELGHSTGHETRLNRKMGTGMNHNRGETYAKEELVAELCAGFLCSHTGIENTIDNTASYIKSWLKIFKDDKNILLSAAGQAQKAYDMILSGGVMGTFSKRNEWEGCRNDKR